MVLQARRVRLRYMRPPPFCITNWVRFAKMLLRVELHFYYNYYV
jgi:hypothetical protein